MAFFSGNDQSIIQSTLDIILVICLHLAASPPPSPILARPWFKRVWKDPPVSSFVTFDYPEARPLVKMGVFKTKLNCIIPEKTILPESRLRLSCPVCNSDLQSAERSWTQPLSRKENILLLGPVGRQCWNRMHVEQARGCCVRWHILAQFWAILSQFFKNLTSSCLSGFLSVPALLAG